MLKLLSPSLRDRQQAYIDLLSHLYRMHGVPFHAAHCGCPEPSEPIPVMSKDPAKKARILGQNSLAHYAQWTELIKA